MSKKNVNARCPLQVECERKCEYENHELDCSYYRDNAVGEDRTIPDQEELREAKERTFWGDGYDFEDVELFEETNGYPGMAYLPISEIYPHPDNPRKDVGDISELAESIKANGIFQNLTVIPGHYDSGKNFVEDGYTAIIGHRRLAAAKKAGLTEVPCVVAEMTEQEQLSTMLAENMQRSDLTIVEQAQGFQMMIDLGETTESIGEMSGFSQTTVRNRLKVASLDGDKLAKAEKRGATLAEYLEISKLEDPEARAKALDAAGTANFKNVLSTAQAEEKFKKLKAEWLETLKTFATEVTDNTGLQYVREYGRWTSTKVVEVPEDADTVNYFYRITNYGITLYKERNAEKESEEQAKRDEERRKWEQLEEEFEAITEAHFDLRADFVRNLSNTAIKNNISAVSAFVGNTFNDVTDVYYDRKEVDRELLAQCLGVVYDDEEDEDTPFGEVDGFKTAIEAMPYKLMFCLAYSAADNPGQGYYRRYWDSGKYQFEGKENETLDRIYEILEVLGYEMSDEELSMQDGSADIFFRNKEENDDENSDK